MANRPPHLPFPRGAVILYSVASEELTERHHLSMLCEKCKQTEATVHTTEKVAQLTGAMKKHDFCEACFTATEFTKGAHGMTMQPPKCENCGAPGVTGWASSMWCADGTISEESHFLCQKCDEERERIESARRN